MADTKQLEFLKSKVSELAQKHRTIVTKLKNDLKEALEISSREKAKAMSLEAKLEEEKRKYYILEAQKSSAPSVDSTKEIMELKSALNAEIQKSTMLANQLKEIAMDSGSIESLKDNAYQKATISRLETDLKSEIERSARIKTDAKEKLESLHEKHEAEMKIILKEKKEIEEKLLNLQKEIDLIRSSSSGTTESLSLKIRDLEKARKELSNQIEEKNNVIDQLSKELEDRNKKVEEFNLRLTKQIENSEEDQHHLQKLIKEQENEIDRICKITDRFDVVIMDRQVHCLKDEATLLLKAPSQSKLKKALHDAVELKKQIRRNVEHLDEFTLNTLQEVDEIENQLRNHIYQEKENN